MTPTTRSRSATGLLLEGLVIVSSILLAFGLEAWWDYRGEREAETIILENLLEEFAATGEKLDLYLDIDRRILAAVETTFSALEEGAAAGQERVSIRDTALALIIVPPTFDPRLGTLSGLLSSGGLGIIQDPELRKELAGWEDLVAEAAEEEMASLTHAREHLVPILWERVDMTSFALLGEGLVLGGIDPGVFEGETAIPVDFPVMGAIAVRLALLVHQVNEMVEVRNGIDRIMSLITESLNQ